MFLNMPSSGSSPSQQMQPLQTPEQKIQTTQHNLRTYSRIQSSPVVQSLLHHNSYLTSMAMVKAMNIRSVFEPHAASSVFEPHDASSVFEPHAALASLLTMEEAIKAHPGDPTEVKLALETIELFKKAATNFDEIETSLKNQSLTPTEKIVFFIDMTGMACHIEDHEYGLTLLGQLMVLLAQIMLPELLEDMDSLISRLISGDPCYEARHSAFFECSETKKATVEPTKTCNDILTWYVYKFNGEQPTGDADDFRDWIIKQDGVLQGQALDGKITIEKIDAFIHECINVTYIL